MSTLVLSAAAARVITVSNDNLFAIASRELGDAAQWTRIARLNGIVDPWLTDITTLKLPKVDPNSSADGVIGL